MSENILYETKRNILDGRDSCRVSEAATGRNDSFVLLMRDVTSFYHGIDDNYPGLPNIIQSANDRETVVRGVFLLLSMRAGGAGCTPPSTFY